MLVEPWMEHAECSGAPVEMFFQEHGGRNPLTIAALKICSECPVKAQCLEYALSYPDRTLPGVWGGTTESTRRKILAKNAKSV